MNIDITLSGYRCFSPEHPVTLSLRGDNIALVGVNNSGKSTLLKALYEFRDIFQQLSQPSGMLAAGLTLNHGATYTKRAYTGAISEIFWHFGEDDLLIDVLLPDLKDHPSDLVWGTQCRLVFNSDRYFLTFFGADGTVVPIIKGQDIITNDPGRNSGVRGAGNLREMFAAFQLLSECYYIPSVRHITSFAPDSGDVQGKFYDIDSGKSFIDVWGFRQQGKGKEFTQRIREVTTDIKKIFHYDDLEIIADQTRRDLLVTANGKTLRLAELGTGLAQFILLLGNIAFINPSYVLIDEPESNLHPTLQLLFVQSIASRSRYGLVFATHNLGLARQAAHRIFSLTHNREESRMTELKDTPNLPQLVSELSFGRAETLGSRRLLLVEGSHDIMTFEALLAAFNKEHECAILSLGGGGGITPARKRELEHIIAINPNIFAIIDSERSTEGAALSVNHTGFIEVCTRLGIKCYVLERRAIENYFTARAIKIVFPNKSFRALGPFEPLEHISQHWPKKNNWRIARAMRKDEIEGTDLGEILAQF